MDQRTLHGSPAESRFEKALGVQGQLALLRPRPPGASIFAEEKAMSDFVAEVWTRNKITNTPEPRTRDTKELGNNVWNAVLLGRWTVAIGSLIVFREIRFDMSTTKEGCFDRLAYSHSEDRKLMPSDASHKTSCTAFYARDDCEVVFQKTCPNQLSGLITGNIE